MNREKVLPLGEKGATVAARNYDTSGNSLHNIAKDLQRAGLEPKENLS